MDKLDKFIPQRRNANKHTQRGMGELERSVQTDGWIGAITAAADGEIFDGSARREVVETALNVEPIIVPSDGTRPIIIQRTDIPTATDPRAIRLGLAANKIAADNLSWDAEVLKELQDQDAALLAGLFRDDELDALLATLDQPITPGDGGDEFDTTPDEGPTRTHLGELWQLGRHKILVGDCTDPANVARLMDGWQIDAVFTSPPYDQQRTYNGNMASDWYALMCGAFTALLQHTTATAQIFVNLGLVHRDGRVVRYWEPFNTWMEDEQHWPLFGWYVWDKLSGMPGNWNGRLAPAHEWIFHFAVETVQPAKTIESKSAGKPTGKSQRNPDGTLKRFTQSGRAVQSHKIPDSVIRHPQMTGNDTGHPAPFPIGLPLMFLEAYRADLWYEPFTGSGTTLIAAERTGRTCFGCEIEPRYADVILKRWEAETGHAATLISRTGGAASGSQDDNTADEVG